MASIFGRRLPLVLLLACGISTESRSQGASLLTYEEPKTLTGTIYSSDRKTVLFKFSRQLSRSGTELKVLREYSYPDGKLAAQERVVYEGNDFRSYELEELQTGGYGRATVRPDPTDPAKKALSLEYSKDNASRAAPGRSSETLQGDTLNNDMVGPFLAAHWDALRKGEEVKCRFIVLSRRETVGFRFVKESESQLQGKPMIILRMEPTSPLIRPLVDALHFKIEKEGAHRVLEYSGRTTPKIRSGNKWKDLDAVTVFDWQN
jgi:hypothetical protein